MNFKGFQLYQVGDFEAQNFLRAMNLLRNTKLHLTTEPQIFGGDITACTLFSKDLSILC